MRSTPNEDGEDGFEDEDDSEDTTDPLTPWAHLPKACGNRRYKGIRSPKCSGGSGCQACWQIYDKRQMANSRSEG